MGEKDKEVRRLLSEVRRAQALGDYARANVMVRDLAPLASSTSAVANDIEQARSMVFPDRVTLLAGLGSALLYLLAWVYALW